MREKYIPALIMLIAGAITCILDIYRKADLLPSLKRLLLVLIIFYIIGLIAKEIITKALFSMQKTEKPDTDNEAIDNSDKEAKDSNEVNNHNEETDKKTVQ